MQKLIIAALSSALLLGACSYQETKRTAEVRRDRAVEELKKAPVSEPAVSMSSLQVVEEVWLGSSAIKRRHGAPLPEAFETEQGVVLVSPEPMPLTSIASYITVESKIPVRLTNGAEQAANTTDEAPTSFELAVSAQSYAAGHMPVNYEGSLSGFLDVVSGYFGVSWFYDGTSIVISKYETRVFELAALPGEIEFVDGLEGRDVADGAAGSEITQTNRLDVQLNYWQDILDTVETILAGNGSFNVSASSGTISVVTTPQRMKEVAAFIEKENKKALQQISFEVGIYSVRLGDEDRYGLDWEQFLIESGHVAISGGNGVLPPAIGEGDGNIIVDILDGGNNQQFIMNAISRAENISTVYDLPMTTLNNRPVSRSITRQTGYIRQSEVTVDDGGQTSVALTPDTVTEGINFQLTPRIGENNLISLQYSLSLTELRQLREVSAGDAGSEVTVELPELDVRNFVQQASLRSGSTLILAGLDRDVQRGTSQGIGSPENYVTGGGIDTSRQRELLVVAITPRILDTRRFGRGNL